MLYFLRKSGIIQRYFFIQMPRKNNKAGLCARKLICVKSFFLMCNLKLIHAEISTFKVRTSLCPRPFPYGMEFSNFFPWEFFFFNIKQIYLYNAHYDQHLFFVGYFSSKGNNREKIKCIEKNWKFIESSFDSLW